VQGLAKKITVRRRFIATFERMNAVR
jgi:hypothetical protein